MKPGPQGRAPTGGLADDFPGGGGGGWNSAVFRE